MREKITVLAAAGLALAAAVWAAEPGSQVRLEGDAGRREKLAAIQGKPAPELQVERWAAGKPLKLSELKGKVVLLDFWGKW
jgi:thiol-disulfide isomerase/thioredoxin